MRILCSTFLATCIALTPALAVAQDTYPNRPVRVVVPFAPGSSIDLLVRLLGEGFQATTGQPMVLDHRAGASGILAADAVAKAAPDGYTLLAATVGQMSLNPLVFSKLPYDAEKSFAPVSQLVRSQYVFVGRSGLPAQTLAEFIAWAKASGKKASFASTQAGGPGHFAGAMLNQSVGLSLTHVPYKGGGPALNDLLGGHVDSFFATVGIASEHMRSGKLRIYAVTSERRVASLPDVPTFSELGHTGVVAYVWSGISVPAGTPTAVINRLHQEVVRVWAAPATRDKLRATDQDPIASSPQEFTQFMHADRQRWAAAVKASGFKAD